MLAGACGAQYPATSAAPVSEAELKYRLTDQFGALQVCGPPVGRSLEAAKADAVAAFPDIQKDVETFAAIVRHAQLAGSTDLTPDQKLTIYNEYQQLKAITFDPSGVDRLHFALLFRDPSDAKKTRFVEGTIDRYGAIQVSRQESRGPPNCPICLAAGTLIGTPVGPVAVEELREGMPIWTVDARGDRVAGRVSRATRTPVPNGHEVVWLQLADGREVTASPGHPAADGRAIGDLRVGDVLDGSPVTGAVRIPYGGGSTYDVLPTGPTGLYWANGILLRSTLRGFR